MVHVVVTDFSSLISFHRIWKRFEKIQICFVSGFEIFFPRNINWWWQTKNILTSWGDLERYQKTSPSEMFNMDSQAVGFCKLYETVKAISRNPVPSCHLSKVYHETCLQASLWFFFGRSMTRGVTALWKRLFCSADNFFVLEETGIWGLNKSHFKYFSCIFFALVDFLCVSLTKSSFQCLNFRIKTIEAILTALSFYDQGT